MDTSNTNSSKMHKITFKDKDYPDFQAHGNAARWIMPFAQYYCKGMGVDIGFSKEEWRFPNSYGVDPAVIPEHGDAMNFPGPITGWDFLFSSHMLEHIQGNWMTCLDYWLTKIRVGGIIFLYLPHKSQEYWLPENNRKHIHSFDGSEITAYLRSLGHDVFCSGVDLNHSFVVVCEKKETRKAIFIKPSDEVMKDIQPLKDILNEPYVKFGDGQNKYADLPFDNLHSHEAVDNYLRSDAFQNLSLNQKRLLLGFKQL